MADILTSLQRQTLCKFAKMIQDSEHKFLGWPMDLVTNEQKYLFTICRDGYSLTIELFSTEKNKLIRLDLDKLSYKQRLFIKFSEQTFLSYEAIKDIIKTNNIK